MSYAPRIFGVTANSVSGLAEGLIANSLSFNTTVETAEARNEKGEIIDLAAYSKGTTVDINGLYVGTGIEPGTVISIGGTDYLVTNSTKNETNNAFQQGTIQARTADSATLHALSSIIA